MKNCEGCDGSGVRSNSYPSCEPTVAEGFMIVERCDWCEKFEDDLSAAKSMFDNVREIKCSQGGRHIVAKIQENNPSMIWKGKEITTAGELCFALADTAGSVEANEFCEIYIKSVPNLTRDEAIHNLKFGISYFGNAES